MLVNGLTVPNLVIEAMDTGLWKLPTDPEILRQTFSCLTDFRDSMLFEKDDLEFQNHMLLNNEPFWSLGYGILETSAIEYMLVRKECLFIGFFGGHDGPLAIDYRNGRRRVVYLTANDTLKWKVAFGDIDDFVAFLSEQTAKPFTNL
jgi:hypothetical protein